MTPAKANRELTHKGRRPRVSQSAIRSWAASLAAAHGLALADLLGPSRRADVVAVRQAAMALARERTGASFPALATAFRRDHTTIQKGIRRHRLRKPKPVSPPHALATLARECAHYVQNPALRDRLIAACEAVLPTRSDQ